MAEPRVRGVTVATQRGRTYGGLTADEREAQRRRKVRDAGLDLFGTKGVIGTRLSDLAERSGVAERYLAQAITSAGDLFEQIAGKLVDEFCDVLAAGPDATTGWRTALDLLAADPRRLRIVAVETFGVADANSAARRRATTAIGATCAQWYEPPDDESERGLAAMAFAGAACELIRAWADGRIALNSGRLADHLAGLGRAFSAARSAGA